jgi:hypothetical protein
VVKVPSHVWAHDQILFASVRYLQVSHTLASSLREEGSVTYLLWWFNCQSQELDAQSRYLTDTSHYFFGQGVKPRLSQNLL